MKERTFKEKQKAVLRLFKGILDEKVDTDNCKTNKDLVAYGVVVESKYENVKISDDTYKDIVELYGFDKDTLNNTFHKSFSTVRDIDIETLIGQALVHYFTTYGLENMGIDSQGLIYIPCEELDLTTDFENEKVVINVINMISEIELTGKLNTLLTSGVALSKEFVKDIITLSEYINKQNVYDIKNKEVRIALYDELNILPRNPDEFLRYMIYKLTGETLLIKSKEMKSNLEVADDDEILAYLQKYQEQYDRDLSRLGSIYNRNKDYFIWLKRSNPIDACQKEINHIINKIAKRSKITHKPMRTKILDMITQIHSVAQLEVVKNDITSELKEVTIYKIISIMNILRYKISIVVEISSENNGKYINGYKIRDGKIYVEESDDILSIDEINVYNEILQLLKNELLNRLQSKLKGKTIYIPDNVEYAIPQSEKQFIGNIPFGTLIRTNKEKKNFVIGVMWNNLDDNERVDLDLSMRSAEKSFGWNVSYRDSEDGVYFSGDMTDATNGATEAYLISNSENEQTYLISLNNFTMNKHNVPYRFVIAQVDDTLIEKNYVFNPKDIIIQVDSEIMGTKSFSSIGTLTVNKDNCTFNFNSYAAGDRQLPNEEMTNMLNKYIQNYQKSQLKIRELVEYMGMEICDKPIIEVSEIVEETDEAKWIKVVEKPVDYDLSLDKLDKTTLVNMLMGV